MDSKEMKPIFGQPKQFDKFCPTCGLPIYDGDKGCPRLHNLKKNPKRDKALHGKSFSKNRHYDYD